MKKNIRYKPSKLNAAMGLAVGVVFVIIGLSLVLPMTFGSGFLPVGLFGLAWTGIAVANVVINALYLSGKRDNTNLFGGYEITDEDTEPKSAPSFRPDSPDHQHITLAGASPRSRLEQLETLRSAGLLTKEEYEEKRKEILKEL